VKSNKCAFRKSKCQDGFETATTTRTSRYQASSGKFIGTAIHLERKYPFDALSPLQPEKYLEISWVPIIIRKPLI